MACTPLCSSSTSCCCLRVLLSTLGLQQLVQCAEGFAQVFHFQAAPILIIEWTLPRRDQSHIDQLSKHELSYYHRSMLLCCLDVELSCILRLYRHSSIASRSLELIWWLYKLYVYCDSMIPQSQNETTKENHEQVTRTMLLLFTSLTQSLPHTSTGW